MIGVDIVWIKRFENMPNLSSFLSKYFTKTEVEYIESRPSKYQTIAGIFAAKESIRKIVGSIPLDKIQILHYENGKPYAQIDNEVFAISISHDGEYAIAVAIRQ